MTYPEFSEEELEDFLEEMGVLSTSQFVNTQHPPLEQLLDEVMGTSIPSSPLMMNKQFLAPQSEEDRSRRSKLSKKPLWLSIAILGSFFLGSIFGFFWGNTEKATVPTANPFEEIDAKLSFLLSEIKEIYEKITPQAPSGEIIEPLEESTSQEEKLAPSAIM